MCGAVVGRIMPEKEQQDVTLSELVVKEAVGKGMDSPMRDSILEAVEEAEGGSTGSMRNLPVAGALFGLGAAVGFLAGRESPGLEETPLEDVQEPEIIDDVMDAGEEQTMEADSDSEEMETESSSRLPRVLLVLGVLAGAAILRRRLGGTEEEEWEPIEEFEPATSMDDESSEDDEDVEEIDAESDEDETESAEETEE